MSKGFSRKDAKVQRKTTKPRPFFAPLRLCEKTFFVSLVLLSLCSTATHAQKKAERFDPDGSFWVHGETPNEFSEFSGINLNAKHSRRLPQPGLETNTGTFYKFKTLVVKRDNFTFTTMTVRGISYSFSGKFLKGGVYAAGNLDDETPVLEGTLTKFRGDKKLAEAKLKFVYFGGT